MWDVSQTVKRWDIILTTCVVSMCEKKNTDLMEWEDKDKNEYKEFR